MLRRRGHFPLLLHRQRCNEKNFAQLEKDKHSLEERARGEQGELVPDLEQKATACINAIVARTSEAQSPEPGGEAEFCALDIMGRQSRQDSLAAGKLFSVSPTGDVWEEERDKAAHRRAELEQALGAAALERLRWPGYAEGAWATAMAEPEAQAAVRAAKMYKMARLAGEIEHQVMEVDRCRARLMSREAATNGAEASTSDRAKIANLFRKIERLVRQWTWWREFDAAICGPAAGWEQKARECLASIKAAGTEGATAGLQVGSGFSPYELFAARTFPWDVPVVQGVSRALLIKYWDTLQYLKRCREDRQTILPNDLVRAVRYWRLQQQQVDDELNAHLYDIALLRADLQTRPPERRADSLLALCRSELRSRLSKLQDEHMRLQRHKAFGKEQLQKGIATEANWWGKGRPLRAEQAPDSIIFEIPAVQEEEEAEVEPEEIEDEQAALQIELEEERDRRKRARIEAIGPEDDFDMLDA